jgi:DNA-binding CsgD family transcriptional regulator
MKFKLLIFFSLWGVATVSFGQYKQMLNKPYKEKVDDIAELYKNTINKSRKDSSFIKNYCKEIEDWAKTNDDRELVMEAELLSAYTQWFLDGHKNPELIEPLISLAETAKIKGIAHIEARAVQVVANHYWTYKDYERAFEWLLRLALILDEMQPADFPNMAEHYNFIGRSYYYFEDYKSALNYYEKSNNLEKTAFNTTAVFAAQATLGLCYQNLGQLEMAEKYFLEVINDRTPYANNTWKGIASGNLGYNYFLKGDFEKSTPLLKVDIQNAILINDYGLAAGALIALAEIYLKQQKFQEAKQKIERARDYIEQSGQTDRLRKLYPIMSKWYAANSQPDSSSAYLDSAMVAINAYNEKYNSLKLLRANQKVDARNRQLEREKLIAESKIRLSQRNFIIYFIVILLIGSLITFWFRNKYLLKKQEFRELIYENTQKALSQAKNQLKSLMLKVREDNKMILVLKKNEAVEENQKLISKLKSKSILTNEDWVAYQKVFNQVYPYFSIALFTYSPDLSQAEIRCMYLEKLNLSNTEMALVLGVSANTIRVTKHRIRKKLDIENQEEMENLIQKLGS